MGFLVPQALSPLPAMGWRLPGHDWYAPGIAVHGSLSKRARRQALDDVQPVQAHAVL